MDDGVSFHKFSSSALGAELKIRKILTPDSGPTGSCPMPITCDPDCCCEKGEAIPPFGMPHHSLCYCLSKTLVPFTGLPSVSVPLKDWVNILPFLEITF